MRVACGILTLICLCLVVSTSTQATNAWTAEEKVVELEARIVALEAVAIVPRDIPITPSLLPPGVDPANVDPWDLVPADPALSVDFVCKSIPTSVGGDLSGGEDVVIPDLQSLSCVRYIRVMPFPPPPIDFYD